MIYADNAATTKISNFAFEKMIPFLCEEYGNASSQYSFGVRSKIAIELSRGQVAKSICAEPSEIIFTSGGSETNSWVLQNIAKIYCNEDIHIITSSIEHHSILNVCHELERRGVDVTYLPVNNNGYISIDNLKSALKPNTKFVSIMYANNEVGTIQPIKEMGTLLQQKGILFHTDAVQAVGHISIDVSELNIDLLTASAHKFNGAKGTGILYKRSGINLPPLVLGGEQENGLRAGTENVAGIVALGYALEESVSGIVEMKEKLLNLVEVTAKGLKEVIPGICFNCEDAERLPGIMNITFPHVSGEAIMHLLDMKGICISTSSACNSGKDDPSHVLIAIGLTKHQAKSSIRISYGRYNTIDDAKKIVETILHVYLKLCKGIENNQ